MKEVMTEATEAEAVQEEEAVEAEGAAVATKKEAEENGCVEVASDPVTEKEDLAVRAQGIMRRRRSGGWW